MKEPEHVGHVLQYAWTIPIRLSVPLTVVLIDKFVTVPHFKYLVVVVVLVVNVGVTFVVVVVKGCFDRVNPTVRPTTKPTTTRIRTLDTKTMPICHNHDVQELLYKFIFKISILF